MLFDSHAHLHDKKFDEDRAEVFARARDAGVSRFLTLGDSLAASRKAIALAESEEGVLAAAGIHPSSAMSWDEETARELETLLAHPKVPVLGEIGLDYYWEKDPGRIKRQHQCFREQLRIAKRLGKPVSIHSRESNADVLGILAEEQAGEPGGVLHCFIGSYEEARRGVDLGFFLGVGGVATYPKSGELRDALRRIGPEHLLVETDSPYLPPQPRRGKRNEPAYVRMTAEALAEELGIPFEDLAAVTTRNTERAFRLLPGNP